MVANATTIELYILRFPTQLKGTDTSSVRQLKRETRPGNEYSDSKSISVVFAGVLRNMEKLAEYGFYRALGHK